MAANLVSGMNDTTEPGGFTRAGSTAVVAIQMPLSD